MGERVWLVVLRSPLLLLMGSDGLADRPTGRSVVVSLVGWPAWIAAPHDCRRDVEERAEQLKAIR